MTRNTRQALLKVREILVRHGWADLGDDEAEPSEVDDIAEPDSPVAGEPTRPATPSLSPIRDSETLGSRQ